MIRFIQRKILIFLPFLALFFVFFIGRQGWFVSAEETEEKDLFPTDGVLKTETYLLTKDWILSTPLTVPENETVTIDLNGYRLSYEGAGRTLSIDGALTLKDSQGTGRLSGGGIRVNGSLIMTGGIVEDNSSEQGCVYLDSAASFSMTGGSIQGNTATEKGGGVYVGGFFQIGGAAKIKGNTGKAGRNDNVYLPEGKTIQIEEGFSGELYVSLEEVYGTVAEECASVSGVYSDDLLYTVEEKDGVLLQVLSPLAEVEVEFDPGRELYPTTDPSSIRDLLTISYRNQNGISYPSDAILNERLSILAKTQTEGEENEWETDRFTLGENTVLYEATGRGGEKAAARFTLETVVPELLSAEVFLQQSETLYFNDSLNAVYRAMNFRITGVYEDGLKREIMRDAEETTKLCQEEYIAEYYQIEIDLSIHPEGIAQGRILIFRDGALEREEPFQVQVSKRQIDLSMMSLESVSMLEGDASGFDARSFAPSLPTEVELNAFFNGEPIQPERLHAGVYRVQLNFQDLHGHYELIGDQPYGKLIVYEGVRRESSGGISYEVTREGGISPEWRFSLVDATRSVKARLSDDLKLMQAYEMSFFPGESQDIPDRFTVRILLSEELKSEEFKMFCLKEDGTAEEVSFTRDGDYLVFDAEELLQTQFLLAVESNIKIYVILSICFGVLCLAGAGVLLWYFLVKKKLSLKE